MYYIYIYTHTHTKIHMKIWFLKMILQLATMVLETK